MMLMTSSKSVMELKDLPSSLGALDMFIGEEEYVAKGIGPKVLELFLDEYIYKKFDYAFVAPASDNVYAIKAYEKADFSIIQNKKFKKCFMLKARILKKEEEAYYNYPPRTKDIKM